MVALTLMFDQGAFDTLEVHFGDEVDIRKKGSKGP